MIRLLALAALAALAACHHADTADVTLDADADARNATAAKTLADLAAADAAAKAPLPRVAVRAPVRQSAPAEQAPDEADAGDLNQD